MIRGFRCLRIGLTLDFTRVESRNHMKDGLRHYSQMDSPIQTPCSSRREVVIRYRRPSRLSASLAMMRNRSVFGATRAASNQRPTWSMSVMPRIEPVIS
jgi:hypothetical protein